MVSRDKEGGGNSSLCTQCEQHKTCALPEIMQMLSKHGAKVAIAVEGYETYIVVLCNDIRGE